MGDYDSMFTADIKSVFLHDFGEFHSLNGQNVLCVIDQDTGSDNPGRQTEPYYGLAKNTRRVFVDERDLRAPEVDEQFSIDGSYHRVESVAREHGMLVIICAENNE